MAENLKVLYQDEYVTITECYILIKKYYIPLMTSKTIMFSEMKALRIEDATKVNNSWGVNTNYLNNWFHYDTDRKNKTKFISIEIKDSRVRPAITPKDVDRAFDVLRQHFAALDRKSVMFQSNRDKETELQQREAAEMMKQQLEYQKEKDEEYREVTQEKLVIEKEQPMMEKPQITVEHTAEHTAEHTSEHKQ